MSSKLSNAAPLALLLGFGTALVALPVLDGDFVWDDHQLIAMNPHVQEGELAHLATHHFWDVPQASTATHRYYRPVVSVALGVTALVSGSDPSAFRGLNLLLHVACALLAFFWLARRLGDTPSARVAAASAVVLIALHPTRPHTISWASGSTDLWATLFVLIGLVLHQRRGTEMRFAIAAGVAFAFALLSKEVAIVAPMLLVADHLAKADEPASFDRRRAAAVAAPVFAALLLRTSVVGLPGATGAASFGDAPVRALFSLGVYIRDALVPAEPLVQLNAPLEHALATEPHAGAMIGLGGLATAAVLVLAGVCVRRRLLRPFLADTLYFILPIAPVLNVLPLGSGLTVADRLLYLPLLGLAALLARALRPAIDRGGAARAASLGFVAICGALAAQGTIAQLDAWRDDDSLTAYAVQTRPHDLMAADNRARVLMRLDRTREAYDILSSRLDRDDTAQFGAQSAISWALVRLELTSDLEQTELTALRSFFDAIAGGRRAMLELPERSLDISLGPEAMADVMTNLSYGDFHDARGQSHLRTLDLEGAERSYLQLLDVRGGAYEQRRLIEIAALAGRFSDAEERLDSAQRAHPSADFGPLAERVARGQTLAPPNTIEARVARSRWAADMGSPVLARTILAEVRADQVTIDVAHARAQAHITDLRHDLALEELSRASALFPAHQSELRAASAEVQRLAATAPLRRYPPPWSEGADAP